MLIDPPGGESKGEQLNSVLPKSPSCLDAPVSPSNPPAGGGACSGETHHATLASVGAPQSQNHLQTIDLSTTRPMYGPPGSINSRRPDLRNHSSPPTVLNYRDSYSGSWDYLNSSASFESVGGARRRTTQSPGYDFRETTARRRSYQETQAGAGHPLLQHPTAHNSGSYYNNDHERKSESPSRKRRRMSHGGVELATSPSPPLVRPWQTPPNQHVTQHHRSSMATSIATNTANQRYHSQSSGDWCNNSGRRSNGRRSPPSQRRQSQRQRERQMRTNQTPPNSVHNSSSNVASGHDRRAFHPPTNTGVHHPRGPSNNQTGGHHPSHPPGLPSSTSHPQSVPLQPHIIIDLSNDVRTAAVHVPSSVPLSIPVSVPSYAVPICTAHSIPAACGIHHSPYPTLSVNSATGGSVGHSTPFPICGMGHIPMCSVHIPSCGTAHHLPISHASAPPMLPQDALVSHLHHSHHHVPHHPQVQYISAPPPPHQTRSTEMELIGERQAAAAAAAAAAFHVPSATHHNPSLTPSPPLHILQEPILRATPTDLHHMHSAQRLSLSPALGRQRRGGHLRAWRNQVSPSAPLQPTYPSWFLRYLFPNPPTLSAGYQVELENDDAEVENYEALLNLAERLGEAKPRGLSKAYIDQLPSYRYNPDTHQSINDQTCCVVCMCDFEQRQLLRVLPCSHEFHARCVDKWLKTNRTCPICRSDASEMSKSQSD